MDREKSDTKAEAEQAIQTRLSRDAALTPGQRIEKLDALSRQLAEIKGAARREPA